MPLNIIQRQLGHANLGTTLIYLQGIDPEEIIAAVHMRRGADDVRQPDCDSEPPTSGERAGAPPPP